MKISIALATYNGERYLGEQLASFVAQSRLPDEVVVCDDDSTDGTWAALEDFAASAPFAVRLHRNTPGLGVAENFAKAISLAEGDLIFLSDQDDVWFPNKLERMAAAFADPEVVVVTCDQEATDAELAPSGQSVLSLLHAAGAPSVMFTIGCCTAFRSSLRPLLLPLPEGLAAHDGWLDALAKSLDVHRTLPDVLQYHRRHGTNASPDVLIPTARVGRIASLRRTFAIAPDQKAFQYAYLEAVVDRLDAVREIARPMDERRAGAIEFARRQVDSMRARQAIAALPRRRRARRILGLWRQGVYRQFSGWRSVVKDLLTPRINPS